MYAFLQLVICSLPVGNYYFWLVSVHTVNAHHTRALISFNTYQQIQLCELFTITIQGAILYVYVQPMSNHIIALWTSGGIPYQGIGNSLVGTAICSGEVMAKPQNCTNDMCVHLLSALVLHAWRCVILAMDRYAVMCRCWEMRPTNRPTFAEMRSHFEGLLEGQHASDYVDFTVSLAPKPADQGTEGSNVVQNMAAAGTSLP